MNLPLSLVFLAGIVSFLSPCVLAMVPIYIGTLGSFVNENQSTQNKKFKSLFLTLFFIAGFSLIFISLGLGATIIGNILYFLRPWIARIGGIFIFIYGLHLTGLLHLRFLDFEWKPIPTYSGRNYYFRSFIMGIVFSAGWSPCIGPILGAILTLLASRQVNPLQGIGFLAIYSLGMAVPFILASFGFGKLFDHIRQNSILAYRVQQVSGVLMCVFGVLLFFGWISKLSFVTPIWSI